MGIIEEKYKKLIDEIVNEKKHSTGISVAFGNLQSKKVYFVGSNGNGQEMNKDTLFDLASITKFFLAVVYLKLNELEQVDLGKCVSFYSTRFPNIGSVRIGQLLSYNVHLETDSRIDKCNDYYKAIGLLENVKFQEIEGQEYSDIPAMVLAELLKDITGKSFGNLFDKYIKVPVGLNKTTWKYKEIDLLNCCSYENEIWVVNNEICKKNNPVGLVNDPKARVISNGNELCGNAGLFMNTDDITKFCEALLLEKILNKESLHKLVEGAGKRLCSDKQTYGYLCYRKYNNPVQTEVPVFMSDNAIASAGFTGCYLLIDFDNKVFVFIGANKLNGRVSKVLGSDYKLFKDNCDEIITTDYVYKRDVLRDELCRMCIE